MDIAISSDDDFTYTQPIFLLTALVGQSVSYGTGGDNYQTVTNGFDEISDIAAIPIPTLTDDDIEIIFDAIGIDDADLVGTTTDAFGLEAERLIHDIFSDGSATEETFAALDEIIAGAGLFESLSDLLDVELDDDGSLDIVAILGLANQIRGDLDTGIDFSIAIDSADSFDFVVDKTTVTKLLGQTASHVSGEDNRQTIQNGRVDETGSVSDGSQLSNTSMAAVGSDQGQDPAPEDFSIVIDTGDDFVFDVGETTVVKMFGQTVSYVTGRSNEQTVTNGNLDDTATNEADAELQNETAVSASDVATDTKAETELQNILISTGDSFDFDIGETTITKMFGQTVSYANGENHTQTVTNGFSESGETGGNSDLYSALDQFATATGEEVYLETATSEVSGNSETDGIIEILTQVADIVGKLEGQFDISIVIDTGDTFIFNNDAVEITKLFGQTVSYANGGDIAQSATNGFDVTNSGAVPSGAASEGFAGGVFKTINSGDPDVVDILTGEFGSEAEQLLDEIFTDDSAIAEVIAALDAVFAQSSFGSVSGLIGAMQNDDDATDVVAVLELIKQIRDDLGDNSELSIAIETGDDFEFNIGTTAVTKMFGQTVSYVAGNRNEQTVVNGPGIEAAAAEHLVSSQYSGSSSASEPQLESQKTGSDAVEDDDTVKEFAIVINSGQEFIFDINETDIVKLFGQTVSYAAGHDITQTVTNGFAVDDSEAANLAQTESDPGGPGAAPGNTAAKDPIAPSAQPVETEQDDTTPNILLDATSTYRFDIGHVEVVKLFGQTVSHVSGENLTQEIVNGFELDEAGDTPGFSLVTSAAEPPGFDEKSFDDDRTDEAIALLTDVAEIVGALEDHSELAIAISARDEFGFDIGAVDDVKLYGQTVSYLSGADNTQHVNNGPVVDDICDWIFDIDSPNLDLTYRMYVAGLGRTPDETGLRFWTGTLDELDANQPWVDKADFLADRFIEAPEFQSIYGVDPSYTDYVEALYWNVLDRAPDAEGHDYWVGRLEAGVGIDDMLVAFVQSTEGIDNIAPVCLLDEIF